MLIRYKDHPAFHNLQEIKKDLHQYDFDSACEKAYDILNDKK
jgi:hypothetical protein